MTAQGKAGRAAQGGAPGGAGDKSAKNAHSATRRDAEGLRVGQRARVGREEAGNDDGLGSKGIDSHRAASEGESRTRVGGGRGGRLRCHVSLLYFVGARGHNCFLVIYIVFPPGTILDICLIPSPRQARRWESARASTQSTAGPCTQPNSSPPIPSSPTLLLMPEAVTAPNPSGVSRAGRGGRKPGARGPASSSPCVRPSVVFPRG